MKFFLIPMVNFLLLCFFSSTAVSANYRSFCKRFKSNIPLYTCIAQEEAAEKRLQNDKVYSKAVAEKCLEKNRIRDRITYYIDYVAADACAKEEQQKIDEEAAKKPKSYDRQRYRGRQIPRYNPF